MKKEIYIISGFLGAGKTTLIRKLLKEAFEGKKVALIENDFGEISIDASLLKAGGVEVKEINSGCICCSLSGDFVKALGELSARYEPDVIIIEPSGVGRLSDIVKACSDPGILSIAEIKTRITVVDVKRCKMYLENFGEFFEDQIKNADVILFSRTESSPEKIEAAVEMAEALNEKASVLVKPWDETAAAEILRPVPGPSDREECSCHGHHEHEHNCSHSHGDDHGHDHENGHGHDHEEGCSDCDHPAEDTFDSVTIRITQPFSEKELYARVRTMEQNAGGTILRAKGIVRCPGGHLNLQYVPGEILITGCLPEGDTICFIGRDLDEQQLIRIFSGE